MASKIVGYSGFKSYAEHPYSSSKPGKELERQNRIWKQTVRQVDHINALQNFRPNKTVYKASYLENTAPKHYHPDHVPKGGAQTLQFSGTGVVKAYDREEAKKYGKTTDNWTSGMKGDDRKEKQLKTGTEHWGSVYKQDMNKTSLEGFQNTGSKFGRKTVNPNKSNTNFSSSNYMNGKQTAGGSNLGRNTSVGGHRQNLTAEEQGRAQSYKNRAYMNHSKMGETDYKFNFGQKIGTSPLDLMTRVSVKQPLRDNPLKRGTNQLWTEIPNYQGFKPSELSFKEMTDKMEKRKDQNKGSLKIQTADNFSAHPPGYGGFKPQFQKQMAKVRQNCFSTTGM